MARKGFSLIELLTVIAIIAILAAIIFPVISNAKDRARNTTCQSNMAQIAKALKAYSGDYDDTYPTNRSAQNNAIVAEIALSGKDAMGQPLKFVNGVNWVEGIYSYIENVGDPGDNSTVWACPSASMTLAGGPNSATSYALNINLLEYPESSTRLASTTLMLREMDRRYGAVCRPIQPCPADTTRPQYAFLTTVDVANGQPIVSDPKVHSIGSNVVFVDGHVKSIPTGEMPLDGALVWDATGRQWWTPQRTIAINP